MLSPSNCVVIQEKKLFTEINVIHEYIGRCKTINIITSCLRDLYNSMSVFNLIKKLLQNITISVSLIWLTAKTFFSLSSLGKLHTHHKSKSN